MKLNEPSSHSSGQNSIQHNHQQSIEVTGLFSSDDFGEAKINKLNGTLESVTINTRKRVEFMIES